MTAELARDRFIQAPGPRRSPVLRGLPSPLRVDIGRPGAGIVIVRLSGDVELLTRPMLVDALDEVLDEWPERVIVALGQVEFLAACGLGVLVEAHERAAGQDCDLVLAAPLPSIVRVLTLTGVDRVIPVYAGVGDALAGASAAG